MDFINLDAYHGLRFSVRVAVQHCWPTLTWNVALSWRRWPTPASPGRSPAASLPRLPSDSSDIYITRQHANEKRHAAL